MPIQFQCDCGNTLRVADEHAGKSARCPDCNAVVQIPLSSLDAPTTATTGNPFANAPEKPKQPTSNPYGSPASFDGPARPKGQFAGDGPIQPSRVEFHDIYSQAFQLWKDNLGLLVGVAVTVMGIGMAFNFASSTLQGLIYAATQDELPAILGGLLVDCFGAVANLFLGIGQVRICLDVARGKQANFDTLFSGADKLLPVIGATIVAYICLTIGVILLIIPGILMALFCWPYYILIADRKTGAMESFSVAYQFGSINVGTTLLIFLVSIVIVFVGIIAACIGIIFAIPLVSMMWAVAYLKMAGQ